MGKKKIIIAMLSIFLAEGKANARIKKFEATESAKTYGFHGETRARRLSKLDLLKPQSNLNRSYNRIGGHIWCKEGDIDIAARLLRDWIQAEFMIIHLGFLGLEKAANAEISWRLVEDIEMPEPGELKL